MLSIVAYLTTEAKLSVDQACYLACVSRRTYYYWLAKGDDCNVDRRKLNSKANNPDRKPPPWALPKEAVQQIQDLLCSPEYVDLSIEQIYYKELVQGRKYCSLRTMQRIAAKMKTSDGGRQHSQRQPRKKPQGYVATEPCSVLCWDITYLGTYTERHLYLYTVIDLYSRYILGHHVFEKQTAKNAYDFLKGVCDTHQIKHTGAVLHSDNGSQMKAQGVKKLLESYGITESHSRPSVSDDNAFMESFYHTLKTAQGLGKYVFKDGDIDTANRVVSDLIAEYHNRCHSGIGFVTPEARFHGKDREMIDAFNHADAAYVEANPERFLNHPRRAEPRKVAPAPVLNPSVDRECLEVGRDKTSQSK